MVFENPGVNMAEIWKKATPYQLNRRKLFENRDWFAQNMDEIWQKYRGKVVAVCDQKIVASGDDADRVWEQIGDKYPKQAVMVILVSSEPVFRVPYPSDEVKKKS
jgi:hypothetical protein